MTKIKDLKYSRIDIDESINKITVLIKKIRNAKSADELITLRNECITLSRDVQTMSSLSYIRFSLNTQDEYYLNEKNYYDENTPRLSALAKIFDEEFLKNKFSEEVFKKINPNVKSLYELSVKIMDDSIVEDLIEDGKLVTKYDQLMSEMEFTYNGKKVPLSVLRKYFDDADRGVRIKSMAVCGRTLEKHSKQLDTIFDKLVKVRNRMAHKLGYDSYAALGDGMMQRYSYGRKEISLFRDAVIKFIVPVVSRLRLGIGKELGIDDLKLYDAETSLLTGNPEPMGTAEDIFNAAKKMYSDMSSETKEFFDFMLDTDAFDVFPKKGKWGGGYCTSIDNYNQPFILSNFNGSSGDVDVLTHEAGHAFAYYEFFKNKLDYDLNLGTMSIAEIHSMAMELLAYKYADLFFEKPNTYKYIHLLSSLTFIPYGTMVDHFQEICYNNPELTPEERNREWLKLEKIYRPYMSADGIPYLEKGTRWQYQMHIYENPMYYIDYCLSQTVAHEIYAESVNDYAMAFEKYMAIVKTGGEKPFEQLVKDAGLGSPFDEKVLKTTAEKIEQEILRLKKEIEK